jgi:predicted MPP superfamily phosphohydrolase
VASDLATALGQLRARDGVVAVLGNHDYAAGPEPVRRALRASGVCTLANDVYTVRRGGALLSIAGVDDVMAGQDRLDLVLRRLPPSEGAILLVHEPDFADVSAATGRFDLQLSGHSHGGQIVVPLYGPLLHVDHARKYPLGEYQVASMRLYTNRGIGQSGLYFRLNCRPEITLFTLLAPGAEGHGAL